MLSTCATEQKQTNTASFLPFLISSYPSGDGKKNKLLKASSFHKETLWEEALLIVVDKKPCIRVTLIGMWWVVSQQTLA